MGGDKTLPLSHNLYDYCSIRISSLVEKYLVVKRKISFVDKADILLTKLIIRGGIDYVERLIREFNGTPTQLRARGFQSIFGLDVSNSRVPLGRFRQRYEKEIAESSNNIIKLSDKHSKQGAFSNGNKYSYGIDLTPST